MLFHRFHRVAPLGVPVFLLLLLCVAAGHETAASSGELLLLWNPPADRDSIDGYRVYFSPRSGDYDNSSYVEIADADASGVRVYGLDDCVGWHFVVRSFNELMESGNSTEVRSWPRARFSSISLPNTIESGGTNQFQLSGYNFDEQDTCKIAGLGCSLAVSDCRTAVVTVNAPPGARSGSYALTVTHPSGVEGVLGSAIQVLDPSLSPDDPGYLVDESPPTVLYGMPRDRATFVVPTARIVLTFSEAVFVDDARIELDGIPLAIRLIGDRTLEVVPQTLLDYDTTYTLTMTGIKDPAGNVQTSTLTHAFTTEPDPAATPLGVPEAFVDGATGDDIVWTAAAGAQYYEVWRCVGASCWLAQNTETHFPSVFDRTLAMEAIHHVGLDGEFLPAGETVLEFVNTGLEYTYKIRGCKSVDGLEICGGFSNELSYVGRQFVCLEDGVEIPCYPGAPLSVD